MGRGRAPCCDKNQVKRGPWSPSEDLRLINFIQNHGHDNWRALPKQAGLLRCGKSCRLRWINYLRPDVKRGNFTIEEEETIIKLHQSFGNKWSKIASHLPGRTDNEIKNVWNTHLKKKLLLSDSHGGGTENKSTPHKVESNQESCTTSLSSSLSSSSSSSISGEKGIGKQLDIEQKTAEKELIWDHELSVSTSHELKGVDSNQFGCGKVRDCEDQSQSLFDFRDLCDVRDDNTFEEVNKPNTIEVSDDVLGTISFEADNDFWNMLDNLGSSFQSNGSINEINPLLELDQEVDPYPAGQLDTGYQQVVTSEDTEKSKWFRYLESELGLEETIDNGCNSSAST